MHHQARSQFCRHKVVVAGVADDDELTLIYSNERLLTSFFVRRSTHPSASIPRNSNTSGWEVNGVQL